MNIKISALNFTNMDNKKRIWTLAILGLIILGCFFSYHRVLRWQVQKRISGIEFEDVGLSFSGVTLSKVKINKGWISGNIDSVVSDLYGNQIILDGGSLSVNLDERPKEKETKSEEQKREIQLQSLQINLVYQKHNFILEDSYSNGSQICFVRAKSENPSLTAINGCIDRDTKIARIEEAKIKEAETMGVRVTDLVAHNININVKEKSAEIELIRSLITFEKQTASIEATGAKMYKKQEKIHLDSVRVQHPWLASDWASFQNVEAEHTNRWNVSVGNSHVQVESETLTASGSEDCSTWIESLPSNLRTSPLDHLALTGKAGFTIALRPKPSFSLKADCRAVCGTLPNLHKTFRYTTYTPKREPLERETGPGSKGWLSIKRMGDMPLAATTMEDPGFEHHHGFITQAFANSLIDNLKEGKFLRGGSTITMQLAKNIWLTRNKTLGRKVQEFFLAQAIESCYSKSEILELYLNAVEFGPNQYGVAAGSRYWFKKSPDELLPTESFWLASVLPRPNKTDLPTEESLNRIESLMKKLAIDGRIPDFSSEIPDDFEEEPLGE
jgi:hypothetical protein